MCTGPPLCTSSFDCSFISVPVHIHSSAQYFNLYSLRLSKHMQKTHALHWFTPNKPTLKSAPSVSCCSGTPTCAGKQPVLHTPNSLFPLTEHLSHTWPEPVIFRVSFSVRDSKGSEPKSILFVPAFLYLQQFLPSKDKHMSSTEIISGPQRRRGISSFSLWI